MTLTLGRLLSQNMTKITVLALETVSGLLKTLMSTLISFHFWHNKKTPHWNIKNT